MVNKEDKPTSASSPSSLEGARDAREMDGYIRLKGVRVNNLKNIDLDIPRGKLLVITGVSGSGKSSLAFDTLYAEGQRRYVESLSAYARQFLGRMAKPECDWIRGLPPAVAIEQRVVSRNARSTVATSTEIYEYLRLLYARIGRTISPASGVEVRKHTVADVLGFIKSAEVGSRVYLLVPLSLPQGRNLAEHLEVQVQQGYQRLWRDGVVEMIEDCLASGQLPSSEGLYLLLDRLAITEGMDIEARMGESCEQAFYDGAGACLVVIDTPDGERQQATFSNVFEADGRVFLEPTPELFSFNNPLGACPQCEGYGEVLGIDPHKVIPDPTLSLYEDCAACWRGAVGKEWKRYFIEAAAPLGFPVHRPYNELSPEHKRMLWQGVPFTWEGTEELIGIDAYFAVLERDIYKVQNRVRLSHFRGRAVCSSCGGGRLTQDALCVQVGGKTIYEVVRMTLDEAKDFFDHLELTPTEAHISRRLVEEIRSRLNFLLDVGLSYLTLDRHSNTLSGGESQRVTLASQLGSSLVGSLYVLDEPSIGLHQRDTARLVRVVQGLRDLGNTVVVVEHDEEMMRGSDYIIDIGPRAGRFGGEVVYAGPTEAITADTPGLTAAYLTGREVIAVPTTRRQPKAFASLQGAWRHNLKGVDLNMPLGCLAVVSGVSGSGKSTLIRDIFYQGAQRLIAGEDLEGVACKSMYLPEGIYQVEYVDQNNIARSSRSNPATYVKAFDEVRQLYGSLPLSQQMGYKSQHFSINKEGGRCETCKGEGFTTVEMQFMADIQLLCEECQGKRYRKEVLEVEFEGVNIHQLLEMSVGEAIEFFTPHAPRHKTCQAIIDRLRPLETVGLGYIKLGQSSSTLSGGENQRVKLAYYLGLGRRQPTLFIFDEPTTGLHLDDIKTLLKAFNALVDNGHSVVVVEHNLEVIKSADWVIDLGPEGGAGGGRIVAEGTPEQVAQAPESWTGRYLSEVLRR